MNTPEFLESKAFRITVIVIACLIVLSVVFRVGVSVGYRRAIFSYQWGENYHRNFGGPRGGFIQGFLGDKSLLESHGVFGQIVSIDNQTLVIKGGDHTEKIVTTSTDTEIMRLREQIKISDLKTNNSIVVIGEPNSKGQIEAKIIRVLPQ